jgi:hypothetical protein
MHNFFLEKFTQAADWFEKRLAYTRSVATSSMVCPPGLLTQLLLSWAHSVQQLHWIPHCHWTMFTCAIWVASRVFCLLFLGRYVGQWSKQTLPFLIRTPFVHQVGYVVGLGDRHSMNVLLDQVTAEVVHIDLGVAFEQGLMLKTPERVRHIPLSKICHY